MLLQLRYHTPHYTINDMRHMTHSSLLQLRYHTPRYSINDTPGYTIKQSP